MDEQLMTAPEAAEALSITLATLYSYVSRGLLRSVAAGKGSRARLYYRDDVRALELRQMQRRTPAQVLEESLHWGAPLLDTSISKVADGRLYYRGQDACTLARTESLEEVAALLWDDDGSAVFHFSNDFKRASRAPIPVAFQIALARAAESDVGAHDLRPASVRRSGARIVDLLARVAARGEGGVTDVASRLHGAWCPSRGRALPLLRAALVLCAEHELNVSAFVARCVASAGATPYAVVTAGLAALSGRHHGGATERVEALLDEAQRLGAREAVNTRLRRGETDVPGFGHTLYPAGDPRATLLLAMLRERYPRAPGMQLTERIIEAVSTTVGEHPTIDLALCALSRTLQLPSGSPLVIFALSRTVGWIAHALEQYARQRIIRPRARYVGPPPTEA